MKWTESSMGERRYGRWTRRVVLAFSGGCAMLASACDQQDPPMVEDSSIGCEPSSPVADALAVPVADSFYPLVDGARWVYRHTGGTAQWDEDVRLTKVAGETAEFSLQDTAGPSGSRSVSQIQAIGAGIYRTYKETFTGDVTESTVAYDPGFVRFSADWPSMNAECAQTLTYDRMEWDARGALSRHGDRTHRFEIEQHDVTVQVPAGEFSGCIVIYRSRVRDAGSTPGDEDEKRFWYCPGVGKVLEHDESSDKKEALVSCSIPGGKCP